MRYTSCCLAVWLCSVCTVFAARTLEGLTCFQQTDPRDYSTRTSLDCSPPAAGGKMMQALTNSGYINQSAMGIDGSNAPASLSRLQSPLATILREPPLPAPLTGMNQPNMFVFDVSCSSSTDASVCSKANTTMYAAGQIISNVLVLTSRIQVNASIFPFCQTAMVCSDGTESLAAAAPARTISLLDDDDVYRLYPQSVVKQFDSLLSSTPVLSEYDINLNINSEAPFYYPNSGEVIESNQTDFLYVILHELFHGLGFTSSYEDFFNSSEATIVTPNILINQAAASDPINFSGFIEYAFDRHLRLATGFVTDIVSVMNSRLLADTGNRNFTDANTLGSFLADETVVGSLVRSLTSNFTTAHTTSFTSAYDNTTALVTLETSLRPYSSGSSVSHLASDLYTNTPDFLMRFISAKGVTLQDTLKQVQSSGTSDVAIYGAIGPGLRGVMASIGYRVRGGTPTGANVTTANTSKASSSSAQETSSAAITKAADHSLLHFTLYILSVIALCSNF